MKFFYPFTVLLLACSATIEALPTSGASLSVKEHFETRNTPRTAVNDLFKRRGGGGGGRSSGGGSSGSSGSGRSSSSSSGGGNGGAWKSGHGKSSSGIGRVSSSSSSPGIGSTSGVTGYGGGEIVGSNSRGRKPNVGRTVPETRDVMAASS